MAQASSAIEVVQAFFDALGPTADDFWSSFERFFDDDTVWENVGLAKTVGVAEAIAFARQFPLEFSHMSVDVLAMAAVGDTVITERVDHFHNADGAIVTSIRVAGSFEVRGSRLAAWRDYFDTAALLGGPELRE